VRNGGKGVMIEIWVDVKEKRPELGGIFLILRPPISSAFHVFSGGLMAVGRGASAIGATVDEG
jgi:hypothetical protein